MDTILWKAESDSYTKRAIELHGMSDLYGYESDWGLNFKQSVSRYFNQLPKTICEIGCGYGAVIYELRKLYPDSIFIGIDPGEESIGIAKNNIKFDNCIFKVGHSHKIERI